MTFEKYARNWMDQQNLIKSTKKTVRQSLEVYCFPVIGDKEPADITEADIDEIFKSERLFNRKGDFSERVYRVLDDLFNELMSDNLIARHPLIHIYSSVVFSHEKIILAGVDVELTNLSPFVDVSCMWLKSKVCLSIRNCIKRAPKSAVLSQHRFSFENPCSCNL